MIQLGMRLHGGRADRLKGNAVRGRAVASMGVVVGQGNTREGRGRRQRRASFKRCELDSAMKKVDAATQRNNSLLSVSKNKGTLVVGPVQSFA